MINSPNMHVIATETMTSTTPSSQNKVKANILAYRGMILYRFILAGVGGYILASLAAIVIAQLFMEAGSSAAMSATLIAFSLNTAAFIWVFMVNKTLKATLGILIPSVLLYITYKFLGN
ncbi:hypothetical protein NI467_13825 [Acinetobacter bohemicus]|uniref:Iron transporter n=1 Tax=Acinetobacter lwoffii TaxID=28090 RepID=A0A9D2UT20_ACILW|nr:MULTISPECIES: hypothetical protein [unclassified Acinetobacter]MCO8046393.1 hypothetical protein [Acinetobacter sp. S4397-1]QKQ68846.1 hypothetical protein E5Y90_00480 [Acinetobacter sp. 10FS3-1]HJF28012.1 hypothetical protein [Acinetobacter lwoffii]